MVTMDVTSLYTNIPNDEGLRASMLALENFRQGQVKPRNIAIIQLLEIVLKKNNFQFNGNHYLQVGGTAIGTKAAPGFAIVYMGMFEDLYVHNYPTQPTLFLRYIDDIFMLWTHGEENLLAFISHLNSRVESIKFTHECSTSNIAFLDVMVKLKEGRIETDLYCKPTDSHDYLLYSSAHPQKCKDSIPYSQFVRIRRLCSNMRDFESNVLEFAAHFHRRQYPVDLIMEAAMMARKLNRGDLLTPIRIEEENDKSKIFLITTYHPSDHSLKNLVKNNWDILGQSDRTSYLHSKRLLVGYRRPKNMRDVLVHANIPRIAGDELIDPNQPPTMVIDTTGEPPATLGMSKQKQITDFFTVSKETGTSNVVKSSSITSQGSGTHIRRMGTAPSERGFKFCAHTICRFCPRLNKSGKIRSFVTGIEYNCMKNISCRSSNLIYCASCKKCGLQYVGQTLRRVKDRFGGHFYDIELADDTKSVSKHFSSENHNGRFDLEISVLEFIKKPPRSEASKIIRDRVERRWIHLLRTKAPKGLNIED